MLRGRKYRNNNKSITQIEEVTSPKRKDIKLTIISNVKTEMASTKKPENANKKSNRNKRDSITSPTIKDFFQPKTVEIYPKNNLMNEKSPSVIMLNDINNILENECSTMAFEHRLCPSNDEFKSDSEDNMISSSTKPVTPHRIVCLSPGKTQAISSERTQNDSKRPERNKKRLDMTYRENSSDEISVVLASQQDGKKTVLNSSANPSARQNTKNNKKTDKQDNANKKLTDFFPIRRSVRKTNKEVQQELLRSYEKAIIEQSEDGLEVKHFENKGRGVVALKSFRKNEFVLEYIGELISMGEANKRELKYAKDENTGCYMYYFKHSGQQFCIDATEETGKLGRLVNHSRNGNLITKTIAVKEKPHLILVAKNDIKPGSELTYDYGDRSKESLAHHPWLAY